DITGFLLILPGSRDLIGSFVKKYFLKYVKENKVEVHYGNQFNQRKDNSQYKNSNNDESYKEDFIDVEAEKVEED
ncbi:MAG: FxsA family protein, partial [Bacillota bacterium]